MMGRGLIECMSEESMTYFTSLIDAPFTVLQDMSVIIYAEVATIFWEWTGNGYCIAPMPILG